MKYLILSVLFSFILIFTSCEDFLEVDQPDIVENKDAFQRYNDGLVTLIGCYQGLQDAVDQIFLLANLRSDLMLTNDNAPFYFKELSDGIYSTENPYLDPSPFYKIVNQTNDIIANLDKLSENDPENFTEAVRNKFEAEATVVRALVYYFLLQNYDGVFYYEDPLTTYDPDYTLMPTPKPAVVDTIINQIEYYLYEKNVGNLVTPDQIDGDEKWYKFRFGEKAAIFQLLGEFYMIQAGYKEGDMDKTMAYQKAFDAFFEVVNVKKGTSDTYSMSKKYALGSWKKIFNSYATSSAAVEEILLTVPFYKAHGQTNHLQYWCARGADGVYYVKPSPVCIAYFESQDESGDKNRLSPTLTISAKTPAIVKYYNGAYSNDNSFALFRAGDSWLDAGEALNHLGKPADALELINSGIYEGESIKEVSLGVRGRVGLNPLEVEDFEPIRTKLELGEEITLQDSIRATDFALLEERARETAFESTRFYDIRRIAEYWDDATIMAEIISSKYKSVDDGRIQTVYDRFLNRDSWYISK